MVDIIDRNVVRLLIHIHLFAYVEIEATTVVRYTIMVLILLVVVTLACISRAKITCGQNCTVRVCSPIPDRTISSAVLENPFSFINFVIEVLGVVFLLFRDKLLESILFIIDLFK